MHELPDVEIWSLLGNDNVLSENSFSLDVSKLWKKISAAAAWQEHPVNLQ